MRKFFGSSDELCREVKAEHGKRVVLAFSAGKDAVASWIQLRHHGFDVFPYYRVLVPGLRVVEEGLAYYERAFGTKIHRVIGPVFYKLLNEMIFQPPRHYQALVELNLPNPDDNEIVADLLADNDIDYATTWTAIGIRASDNLARSTTIKRSGPTNIKRRTFYPIYDWKNDRVFTEIRDAGLKLTVDYAIWGRSFDGLHHRFLAGLKEHYPDDFERVKEFFPLADIEFKRLEFREKYWAKEERGHGQSIR